MLLIFVLLGLVFGFAFGGRMNNIKTFSIQMPLLPIIAFAVKGIGGFLHGGTAAEVIVCVVHYVLLLLFFWFNRNAWGWSLPAAVGTMMNFAVVLLNGGRMPVSAELLFRFGREEMAERLLNGEIFAYCLSDSGTKLAFLGDILPVSVFGRLFGFASVGDVVLGIGCAVLAFRMVKPPKSANEETVTRKESQ